MPREEADDVAEHQTRLSADDVEPDRAEDEADANREDGLRNVVAAEADEGGEGEQHQGEDFGIAESASATLASAGAKPVNSTIEIVPPAKDAMAAAISALSALPLQRQRTSVERGRDRGRGAGYARA